MDWHKKQVLVVGKGVSGQAAYLRLSELGAMPSYYDDHDCEGDARQLSVSQIEGRAFDFAVVSPGVRPDNAILALLARHSIPLISEPDLGYLLFGGITVAVTGTNGKTTTVRLVESILRHAGLKVAAVGNIGTPFCAVREPLDVAVVEMSSFQCHYSVLFAPTVAAVTNLAPDHMEWHGTMQRYRQAKLKLLETAGIYAHNVDDPDLPQVTGKPCITYSMTDAGADVYVHQRDIYVREKGDVFRVATVDELPLAGNHNVYNVLCALALAVAAVGYHPQYSAGILAYRGEPMRNQQLTFTRPYVFNDSKGTNTSATMAAMRQMVGTTALLLGGWDKGEDFTRLFRQLSGTTALIAFGAAGRRIYADAVAYGIAQCVYVPTVADAVREAVALDKDNILFSPACSSFDQYDSYMARGADFEREIHRYFAR